MKKFTMAVGAAIALASVTARAQAQTVSSLTGTTSSVSGIDESIFGRDMGGMRVTATFGDFVLTRTWAVFDANNWGVTFDKFGSLQLGTNTNTYSGQPPAASQPGPWKLLISTKADIDLLVFEGGAAYGGVLFDRKCSNQKASTSNCTAFGVGTTGSSLGEDADFTGNSYTRDFNKTTVTYTNAVGLGIANPVGDLFTKVTMDFTDYKGGPDYKQSPIEFFMDTDKGSFSTVPEPSTYALMGAGLLGIFGFARRRNRTA
ncbi:PEP-CTERM sorting domain-containing protein [Gemmatimonas sp.]|uniref:PEP-CTERM sorting domain-containing protein n=1 Tax=Gemmatimonas sp. TaxID=1962908 RepID=UPI0035668321